MTRPSERFFRVLGALFFLGAAAWVATRYAIYGWKSIWACELAVYLVIAASYARRSEAFERASSFAEIGPPLVGGVLPFAFQPIPYVPPPPAWDVWIAAAMLAGVGFTLVSYVYLGPSFAILVEARPLRARGPYRFVRHPVYLGQIVTFAAVAFVHEHRWSTPLWASFVVIQVARAFLEERKLARSSPGYAEYRAKTWMFVPFVV